MIHDNFSIYQRHGAPKTGVACCRIDYMGDENPNLVEYNLMSVGLNGMSDQCQNLHTLLHKNKTPKGKFTFPESQNQKTIC